jgi:hypothetical protein
MPELEQDNKNLKVSKKEMFCYKSILEFKENLETIIVKGYIATTHFDGEDRLLKSTLEKWAKEINEGNPRTNKVSVNHDRIPHVAGVGIKGSARVDRFSDGEYGLYAETLIDKTRDDFDELKWRISNNLLDSFSIEYFAPEDCKIEKDARLLDDRTELYGWTLASQPMNEHAVMIKELIKKKEVEFKEQGKEDLEKLKSGNNIPDKKELTEETKMVDDTVAISKQDHEDYLKFRDFQKKEMEVKEREKIMADMKTDILKEVSKVNVDTKTMNNSKVSEMMEVKEYLNALKPESKISVQEQFQLAGKTAMKLGLIGSDFSIKEDKKVDITAREYKHFATSGTRLQVKGLGITTNQNTDTDYLQSAPELHDVYDPVIYNALNQATVLWNLLAKDDYSNKGNNKVQFKLKIAANKTAGFYSGNGIITGNVTRATNETKFKKCMVGVEVDGDMIAAARGGPVGDVFSREVMDSTDDLLSVLNSALYAEVGAETADGIIGLAYISDSAGNTSLYSMTRSTTNKLAPDAAADTYINGASADLTQAQLRQQIRQAIKEGEMLGDIFFVGNEVQGDKVKSIYDDIQRIPPVSSRFGFEGNITVDGVPFFVDKDCKSASVFCTSQKNHRVAIWVPPTLEMLGKDADSQKGFIKTYLATYFRKPRAVSEIYSLKITF